MDIIIRKFIGNVKIPSHTVSDKDMVLSIDKRNKETWVEREWWKVFPRISQTTITGNSITMCGAATLFTHLGEARAFAYHFEERVRADKLVDESLLDAIPA